MTTPLEYAIWYAQQGMAVLPLHWPMSGGTGRTCSCRRRDCPSPAKHPFGRLVQNGLKDASREPPVIERWFSQGRLNVGIATGAASGIVALDIDPRHGGDRALGLLEAKHGRLPPTWRFLTGGGGEHILFRHPGSPVPNSAGKLAPGIDVRGDGGYIVAPPSEHISGRAHAISVDHHPDELELADLPPWLLQGLAPRRDGNKAMARSAQHWREVVASAVAEGERNRTLASLAGHLLRHRIDPWVALDLVQAWNRARCHPPLADGEVMATVRSIARREIARREARHAR